MGQNSKMKTCVLIFLTTALFLSMANFSLVDDYQAVTCSPIEEHNGVDVRVTRSDLADNALGQVVEYRCKSGRKFDSAIRVDDSEYVITECNSTGHWQVLAGDVATGNESKLFTCKSIAEYVGCYNPDFTSAFGSFLSPSDQDKTNIVNCQDYCKRNMALYAAMKGDGCYCLEYEDFMESVAARQDCDVLCPAGALFCGGDTEASVYRTIDSCISISYTELENVDSRSMFTSETCRQHCRGNDWSLAFYRAAYRLCTCLAQIPSFVSLASAVCASINYGDPQGQLIGSLYITAEGGSWEVHSCSDVYDQGIFYHGQYKTQNDTKIQCSFYDGSVACSQGWVAYNKHCYYFIETSTNIESQAQACRDQDSLLVSIGDDEEWTFLKNSEKVISHVSNTFFVGLYDTHQTFSFEWADETAFTFRPFKSGWPVRHNGVRRCGVYNPSGLMNSNCQWSRQAVCEKSEKNRCMSPDDVGDFTEDNKYLDRGGMSIALCFETCRGEEKTFSVINGTMCYCFSDPDLPSGTQVSMTNCDLSCTNNPSQPCGSRTGLYFFVTADEDQPYHETCDAMILDGLETKAKIQLDTNVQECGAEHADNQCPATWLPIGESCYRPIPEPSADAAAICQSMGGYLAVFDTQDEKDMVRDRLGATPSLASHSFWKGGLARAVNNVTKYTYSNGAWVDDETYAALPRTSTSRCITYHASNFSIAQHDAQCDESGYICEKGADYLGCFSASSTFSGYLVISNYSLLNLRQCMESCQTYSVEFFGVISDPLPSCYCLKVTDLIKTDDYRCEKTCAGHQACGDNNDFSVYRLDTTSYSSSCEALYSQGVLLTNSYEVPSLGSFSLCPMRDSVYYRLIELCDGVACPQDRVFIGQNKTFFGIDVTDPMTVERPELICQDLIEAGSTTVASIRTEAERELLTDFLNWSVNGQTWTVIGLVDEFLTGCYTWADGYLYRPGDVNLTQSLPPHTDYSKARYTVVDHTGYVSSVTGTYHVACTLETRTFIHPECYEYTRGPDKSQYDVEWDYPSMSVTLCRQLCQLNLARTFFVSITDCICTTGPNVTTRSVNTSDCTTPCPGNRMQLCGGTHTDGTTYFRKYTFDDWDFVNNCSELYDNYIVREGVFRRKVSGDGYYITCGLEDFSFPTCPAGFIAKGGRCLRFMRLETESVSSAGASCLALNAGLASILTSQHVKDVLDITRNISSLSTATLWGIGLYSPLNNGYYVDSAGCMISPTSELLRDVTLDQPCMALDAENETLVAVSCDTVLPYICQNYDISGINHCITATTTTDYPTPDLSLPTSMTSHQCIEFCRGKGSFYAMIRYTDCFCDLTGLNFALSGVVCGQACAGHPFQMCGSERDVTIYSLTDLPAHTYTTCEDLLSYAVTVPANYMMANDYRVTCFKYTSQSDYIMANNDSILVTASSFYSSDFKGNHSKLDIRSLSNTGWVGGAGQSQYTLTFDLLDMYVIQGFIISSVPNYAKVTSLSIQHLLFDSVWESYPLNPVNITYPSISSLAWVDVTLPFAARRLIIELQTWEGSTPGCAMEFIGYNYAQDWVDTQYLGTRGPLHNESSIALTFETQDFNECSDRCRDEGYYYFKLTKNPAGSTSCSCLSPTSTIRDFYTDAPETELCLNIYQCMPSQASFTALYSTYELTCEPLNTTNVNIGTDSLVPSSFTTFTIGTTLYVTCIPGHMSDQWNGTYTTSCRNYRVWSQVSNDLTCSLMDCGPPPQMADLTLAPFGGTLSTTYQASLTYQCEAEGHLINGMVDIWVMTCGESGQWAPIVTPTCLPITCPNITAFNNSYVVPEADGVYVYGDVAAIKCDAGYVFNGTYSDTMTVECQSDGTWTDAPSTYCREPPCPAQLPAVSHASGTITSDTEGLYECNGGCHFSDHSTSKAVSCNSLNNQWQTTSDSCSKKKQFGTRICKVQEDKCMSSPILTEVTSRSLVACALTCSDTPYCRSVCYRRVSTFADQHPNCRLVSSEWDYEREQADSGWDFYDTFGISCS